MATTSEQRVTTRFLDGSFGQDELHDIDEDDMELTTAQRPGRGGSGRRSPQTWLGHADVVPFLKQQHFYDARHRHIYDAMAALFDRAAAIDYHTIAEEPEHQGTYEQAGGQHLVTRGVPDHLIEDLNLDRPGISAGLGRLAEPS